MTSAPLDAPASALSHPAPKLMLAIAVALIGDRLFYDHALGISVAVFIAVIATAAWVANLQGTRRRDSIVAVLLLVSGLAPLVETVATLSLLSGVTGIALFCAVLTGGLRRGMRATSAAACGLVFMGPFDLVPDVYSIAHRAIGNGRLPRGMALLGWIVPIALCGVFAGLFASANPLIDAWISEISWSALIPRLDLARILVAIGLLAVAWPFIAPRLRPRSAHVVDGIAPRPGTVHSTMVSRLLDPATVLRCLVLFNLLFALQSALDVAYLWGGLDLPPGITHAAYAHRGAYPLIVTALLAAAFVLVALRPGGAGERSARIRSLVFLWVAQNILLVASAMLRLDLYVAAYSLTFPRVGAFIWMALVAVGLVLILARIALRRTNGWLIGANLTALAATLYVSTFVNFAGFVASYNVAHGFDAGRSFDLVYAMNLGAEAIPAVDRVLADGAGPLTGYAVLWRAGLAAEQKLRMQDWRTWTFRGQRLLDYIEAHPQAPAPGIAGALGTR